MRNSIAGANLELLLLEIASLLKALINQPDLEKKIKNAYTLNDAEKAQLELSKETIANANALKKELAQKESAYLDIEKRIQENKDLLILKQKVLDDIKQATIANNKHDMQIKQQMEELKKTTDFNNQYSGKLAAKEKELKELEQSILNQKADIKAAIDKSKLILGGIGE